MSGYSCFGFYFSYLSSGTCAILFEQVRLNIQRPVHSRVQVLPLLSCLLLTCVLNAPRVSYYDSSVVVRQRAPPITWTIVYG